MTTATTNLQTAYRLLQATKDAGLYVRYAQMSSAIADIVRAGEGGEMSWLPFDGEMIAVVRRSPEELRARALGKVSSLGATSPEGRAILALLGLVRVYSAAREAERGPRDCFECVQA